MGRPSSLFTCFSQQILSFDDSFYKFQRPIMLPRPYYTEQDARKRQIDTLKIFNEHVVEINENSEYCIEFHASGTNMSLNVILGPEFPTEKPTIYVNPPIVHAWVGENSNQVVGAPGLINYTQHSDLGRVVQAIIREFQKYVPNSDELKSSETSPQSNYSVQSLMFPELNEFTIDELHEILENPDLQVTLVFKCLLSDFLSKILNYVKSR